jgi:hypothetical protein
MVDGSVVAAARCAAALGEPGGEPLGDKAFTRGVAEADAAGEGFFRYTHKCIRQSAAVALFAGIR